MSKYILYNLNYAAPYSGNLMRSIFALEKKIICNDVKIIYLFPDNAKSVTWVQEMIQNGSLVFFKNKKKIQYKTFRDIISKYNVSMIHTHFWNLYDCLIIRLLKLQKRNLYTIIHHHNHYFESKNKLKEIIKRFIIKSDIHITCGEDVADLMKNIGFKNVFCAENAIDFNRLDCYDAIQRNNLGIKENKKIFLMFGFDYYRKGIDIAIKAFKNIAEKHNIVLAIVFSTNAEDGIKNIKEELGEVPTWIKILPPNDDIASYYHIADVFISASREEGFCYAIPEAAYCGCNVIISNISGQQHAKSIPGISIFELNDIDDLRTKLENNGNNINDIEVKTYLKNRYGLNRWCNDIIDIYNKCMHIGN